MGHSIHIRATKVEKRNLVFVRVMLVIYSFSNVYGRIVNPKD
jgi:hypothetical protein